MTTQAQILENEIKRLTIGVQRLRFKAALRHLPMWARTVEMECDKILNERPECTELYPPEGQR